MDCIAEGKGLEISRQHTGVFADFLTWPSVIFRSRVLILHSDDKDPG